VPETFSFSPDSSKFGYIARSQVKSFVVINEEESDAFDLTSALFRFSPDGKRVAFFGRQATPLPGGTVVYVDGKAQRSDRLIDFNTFTFSADGAHYANSGAQGVYLDGKPTGVSGKFVFSPDGKHLAVVGSRAKDRKMGIYVDGQLAGSGPSEVRFWGFSPDSQHLYWIVQQDDTSPGAAPASRVWATYVDGKVAATFDRVPAADFVFGQVRAAAQNPAWQIQPDGTLVSIGPVGDALTRFSIKASGETNIGTMLAAAASDEKSPAPAKKPAKRTR
jgi:hypothetical protein